MVMIPQVSIGFFFHKISYNTFVMQYFVLVAPNFSVVNVQINDVFCSYCGYFYVFSLFTRVYYWYFFAGEEPFQPFRGTDNKTIIISIIIVVVVVVVIFISIIVIVIIC